MTHINARSRLRSHAIIESWAKPNDGTRSLIESAMVPELATAIRDWSRAHVADCVLIGGLALSFHGRARMTSDCDFLFLSAQSIPAEVPGFKRLRIHAFRHNATHVEFEVLDPEFLKMEPDLAYRIWSSADEVDGIRVASRIGLIASKLGRFSRQDQADIEHLLEGQDDASLEAIFEELSDFPLSQHQRALLSQFQTEL